MHWTIQSLHHKHVLIYHITWKRPTSFALLINNCIQLSQRAESQPRKKSSTHSRFYLVTSSRGIEKRNANTTIVIGQVVDKRYTSTTELRPTQTQIPFVKDKLVWRKQACKQLIALHFCWSFYIPIMILFCRQTKPTANWGTESNCCLPIHMSLPALKYQKPWGLQPELYESSLIIRLPYLPDTIPSTWYAKMVSIKEPPSQPGGVFQTRRTWPMSKVSTNSNINQTVAAPGPRNPFQNGQGKEPATVSLQDHIYNTYWIHHCGQELTLIH